MFLMWSLLTAGGLAAGLASIPVVIHLLHRQRTTPVAWGAMQFLLDSAIRQKRRRNVDHWILMLLRMLVLGILVLMLSRPFVEGSHYNPLASNTSTDVAVVIDHSLSTGRRAGDGTIFQQASGSLKKIIDFMKPGDTLSVVLSEHQPRVYTPLPLRSRDEMDQVRRGLHDVPAGMTDGSIPDAVQAARDLVSHGQNLHKAIVVISDEQRNDWQVDATPAWTRALGDRLTGPDRNLDLYALPIPPTGNATNVSVGAVSVGPTLVGVGREAQVTVALSNSGPDAVPTAPTELTVDGKVVGRQNVTDLAAGQTRTLQFGYVFTDPGSHWIKVQTTAVDALEADNTGYASLTVFQKLPVLVIDGQLTSAGAYRSSEFLDAAMRASGFGEEAKSLLQPRIVSVSESAGVNLDDYFVTVLNDVPELPASVVNKLSDYARSGHGVWLILGPRTQPAFVSGDLGRTGLMRATLAGVKRSELKGGLVGASVDVKRPENAMVEPLTAAQRNAMSGVLPYQWWAMKAADDDFTTVLAGTVDQDPLVLEKPVGTSGGRLVVWTTSVDGRWNNFPLVGSSFVPLVNETIFHLAAGMTQAARVKRLDAGGPIVWTGKAQPAVEGATVTRPDGATVKINPVLTNGRYILSYNDTFLPGRYDLRFTPTDIPQPVYYTVGLDPRELDPATLSAADYDRLRTSGFLKQRITEDDIPKVLGTELRGTELWPWLAFAVLAMLLFETFLTYRMIRLQDAGSVEGAGLLVSS